VWVLEGTRCVGAGGVRIVSVLEGRRCVGAEGSAVSVLESTRCVVLCTLEVTKMMRCVLATLNAGDSALGSVSRVSNYSRPPEKQ